MNSLTISVAPANSVVFVADPNGHYDVPLDTGSALITATSSCIAVGTLAEMDGETTLKLSRSHDNASGELAFDGNLETPSRTVAIVDSSNKSFLSMAVTNATTHVKIWVNDSNEPNLILIQAE